MNRTNGKKTQAKKGREIFYISSKSIKRRGGRDEGERDKRILYAEELIVQGDTADLQKTSKERVERE